MKLMVNRTLYVDGERVRMFSGKSEAYITNWAHKFCPFARTIEIRTLCELDRLPAPSRQPFNAMFENYGAYRVNPFVSMA